MISKYNGGVVPKAGPEEGPDAELKELAVTTWKKVEDYMEKFSFNNALESIWVLIRRINKYIDETAPWILAKSEDTKARLDTVLHNLEEGLRIVSILIYPFMHETSIRMRKQLGLEGKEPVWEDAKVFDITEGISVEKGEALFPRLDVQAELEALEKIKEASSGAPARSYEPYKDAIEYPDFEKLDLRTGTIISAEKHPKADKLLVFKVQMGSEVRQIVSGVAESYKPEECVGKNVIIVANLKPRTLRGVESNGMLLFADQDGKYIFASTEAEPGMVVC